jgi:hypothetical protein
MKKISIKVLVVVFIVGFVLLNGARLLVMGSSDLGKGIPEKMVQERMIDGDFSEEQMEEYFVNDGFHRRPCSLKHR